MIGNMLKSGQQIGMGMTTIGILAEITSIQGNQLECYVVNGNWYFHYNISTATASYDTPCGHEQHLMKILYTAPIPKDVRGYNDILDYMNQYYTSSWWSQLAVRVSYTSRACTLWVREAPHRLKAAFAGFVMGWNDSIPTPPTDEYDDDIPF